MTEYVWITKKDTDTALLVDLSWWNEACLSEPRSSMIFIYEVLPSQIVGFQYLDISN